ncbi:hypothetical protein MHBO_001702, partial [Bonamia ostreae]
MAKIAVLGDICTDIQTGPLNTLPTWNRGRKADTIKLMIGGSAGNTARYLGALGKQTRLFSVLGDDDVSRLNVLKLKEENLVSIDGSVVQKENDFAPIAIVLFGMNKRQFIIYSGSLKSFTVDDINSKLVFENDHLHFGGYFVCPGLHNDKLIEFLKQVKARGITISMDCQGKGTQKWTSKNNHLRKVLPFLDVFMPSSYEALGITNTTSVDEAIDELSKLVPETLLIIKNGEEGVVLSFPKRLNFAGGNVKVPTEKVSVKDVTGAGDAFNAGFLAKWVEGLKRTSPKDLDKEIYAKLAIESAEHGCHLGSRCVQEQGAFVKSVCD